MGNTFIQNYEVSFNLFGSSNDFQLGLESKPALRQDQVFSLISLGYINEVNSGLNDADREIQAASSIGSLILDQLEINRIARENFGLNLSLGAEKASDQRSFLEGAQGGSEQTVQTATTLEISKKLTKNTAMSVSTTLGGNIGQKQAMDISYGVNKVFSLEGVYEQSINQEGDSDFNNTSAGGDLKFKWRFK